MEHYREEIKTWIVRSVLGQLKEEEREKLEIWLQNPGHRRLYEQICDRDKIWEKLSFYDRHSPEVNWMKFRKRIYPSFAWRWMRYAAVLLIPVFLSLTAYFIYTGKSFLKVEKEAQLIIPGSPCAMIYLADGSQFVLQKDTVFHTPSGAVLKNEAGQLSYEKQPALNLSTKQQALNLIKTPRGGEYQVVLSDGTKVWLNAESSLRFPGTFAADCRKVYAEGELYFEVVRDEQKPFLVVSGKSVVEVLGTEFNVRNYTDTPYSTTLVKGSIALKYEQGEPVKLKPGQQAVLNEQTSAFTVAEVNVESFIAWKNGYFLFDNMSLEEIMNELARWYDIEVFFANEAIRNERFSVELPRHEHFREMVQILERTGCVHFSIDKQAVTVR